MTPTSTSTPTATTRAQAEAVLLSLAVGLEGPGGAARLLERIASSAEPELLRSLLLERGALALVNGAPAA